MPCKDLSDCIASFLVEAEEPDPWSYHFDYVSTVHDKRPGYHVNTIIANGYTTLSFACIHGNIDIIRELLQVHGDPIHHVQKDWLHLR